MQVQTEFMPFFYQFSYLIFYYFILFIFGREAVCRQEKSRFHVMFFENSEKIPYAVIISLVIPRILYLPHPPFILPDISRLCVNGYYYQKRMFFGIFRIESSYSNSKRK